MAITASSIPDTSSPNVTRFPARARERQTPLPNRDTPYSYSNHDHDNNNNNRVRAHAYARERRAVDDAYQDVFGRVMPVFVAREVEFLIAHGVQVGMIRAVIEYTACAPRPSWAYARAVLYRNKDRGIVTEQDFEYSLQNRGRDGCEDLPY